jgi:hypothetical protein
MGKDASSFGRLRILSLSEFKVNLESFGLKFRLSSVERSGREQAPAFVLRNRKVDIWIIFGI